MVSIVERDGQKRSFVMPEVTGRAARELIAKNVEMDSNLMTDESSLYPAIKKFRHYTVNHSKNEYARKQGRLIVHTNTVESSFSLLERGIIGSFHHVSRKHLPKYVAEFDFRWNHRKTTCGERTIAALATTPGKRLEYAALTAKA